MNKLSLMPSISRYETYANFIYLLEKNSIFYEKRFFTGKTRFFYENSSFFTGKNSFFLREKNSFFYEKRVFTGKTRFLREQLVFYGKKLVFFTRKNSFFYEKKLVFLREKTRFFTRKNSFFYEKNSFCTTMTFTKSFFITQLYKTSNLDFIKSSTQDFSTEITLFFLRNFLIN